MYRVIFAKQAAKDFEIIKRQPKAIQKNVQGLLDILQISPLQYPPEYEKLEGDLSGIYSRRINRQHRLIYSVNETELVVRVLRMWTHYE